MHGAPGLAETNTSRHISGGPHPTHGAATSGVAFEEGEGVERKRLLSRPAGAFRRNLIAAGLAICCDPMRSRAHGRAEEDFASVTVKGQRVTCAPCRNSHEVRSPYWPSGMRSCVPA